MSIVYRSPAGMNRGAVRLAITLSWIYGGIGDGRRNWSAQQAASVRMEVAMEVDSQLQPPSTEVALDGHGSRPRGGALRQTSMWAQERKQQDSSNSRSCEHSRRVQVRRIDEKSNGPYSSEHYQRVQVQRLNKGFLRFLELKLLGYARLH